MARPLHGRDEVSFLNAVLLRRGDEALSVNGCAITGGKATTGEQLSHNSFRTKHRFSADHLAAIDPAGRGRWQSENENHHVLKTKGDPREHPFGHGQQSLAAFLLRLTLLALLFQTVWGWSDEP